MLLAESSKDEMFRGNVKNHSVSLSLSEEDGVIQRSGRISLFALWGSKGGLCMNIKTLKHTKLWKIPLMPL